MAGDRNDKELVGAYPCGRPTIVGEPWGDHKGTPLRLLIL